MPAFGLVTLHRLVLDIGCDGWIVVLRSSYEAVHFEFPCTSSGQDVKNKAHPKTDISEGF